MNFILSKVLFVKKVKRSKYCCIEDWGAAPLFAKEHSKNSKNKGDYGKLAVFIALTFP